MIISPRWKKVVRDILGSRGRTALVVLAISVGIIAFGSALITQEVLLRNMNEQYAAINPATVSIGVSSFEEGLARRIEGMESVAVAQGQSSASVRLQTGDDWAFLNIYAFPNYEEIRINRIYPEKGAWPPSRQEILLERASAATLDVKIGDTVVIKLPNDEERQLTFAGIVHDLNVVPPSIRPNLTGYVTIETLAWLGYSGRFNRINVVPTDNPTDMTRIEAVAAEVKNRLEYYGYSVGSVDTQKPDEHWASDTTGAFVSILIGIGLFALFLSCFLIINTSSAVLAQQKRQIGIMKAIGATGEDVVGIYLMMILLYGLMALVIAIPLSIILAQVALAPAARFLNIDIVDFRPPAHILVLQVLVALIVPVLAAMFPVLKGTRVTVRQAISDYGISETVKPGLIDLVLARVQALPRPMLLSLRNTFRRRGRLVLTLITLTLAGTIFMAVINVRGSMMAEMNKIINLFHYDLQIAFNGSYQIVRLEHEALLVPGVVKVEGWALAQAQRIRPDGSEGATFSVFGPPADTSFIEPTLLKGRWLRPDDQNAIVLSSEMLRKEPDIQVGEDIVLQIGERRKAWQVVGVINLVGQEFAYVNFDYLSRFLGVPGRSSVLMVDVEQSDESAQRKVAQELEDHFKDVGIDVSQSFTMRAIVGAAIEQFNFLIGFLLAMSVMLGVVSGLGLAGTMTLNVLERTREIGVMRTIGASDSAIQVIVILEGLVIGLISWLLGAVCSTPISRILIESVGAALFERPLDFVFSFAGVLAWLAIAFVIAAAASLVPALRASQVSVREALTYE